MEEGRKGREGRREGGRGMREEREGRMKEGEGGREGGGILVAHLEGGASPPDLISDAPWV